MLNRILYHAIFAKIKVYTFRCRNVYIDCCVLSHTLAVSCNLIDYKKPSALGNFTSSLLSYYMPVLHTENLIYLCRSKNNKALLQP